MYIEREIAGKFRKVNGIYPIIAVVGARQSGKTTFLRERMKGMNASYLLFDDPDVRQIFDEDVKKFENQYISGHDVSVLDEVQYAEKPGQKLKYLADNNRRLWITSSSEVMLGKEVLSYLVGRVSIIRLYPFSIQEFLALKGQKELTPQILNRLTGEHIRYGGYPKAAAAENAELKTIILRDLYDTMILKDVANTFSINDMKSLENFARYLSVNIGSIISYGSISGSLGISFQTVKKYLDAMEKSYLIARVQPFYRNKSKELTKQPKVYFIDTGLRNVIANDLEGEPGGKLFENYVFSELTKIGFTPKYWRTKSKAEVDFMVEKGNEIIPVEVKLDAGNRIEKSLRSFIQSYKPKRALVVSYKVQKAGEAGKGSKAAAGGTEGKAGGASKSVVDGCAVHFTDILGMRNMLMDKLPKI